MAEVVRADVAIIGAGPAGTATALQLGRLGVRDVVLVDKRGFPRDKTCGSGVSPKGIAALRELGVWEAVAAQALPIHGLRLVTPGDREVWVSGGVKADAVVCKRRVLDHVLLQAALARGVRFVPDVTATALLAEGGRVAGFVARDGREFRARHTVVAGGAHCRLTTRGRPRPERLIQAIMGWWRGVDHRAGHVEMIFDRTLAPCYGWLFPEGDGVVNIGITYEDPSHEGKARELFQRFLDKHYGDRLVGAAPLGRWKGHPIAWDYAVADLTSPGRLVVGEAGRMTHPATAEGIYQGLRSGMLAAESLRDVLLRGRSEPGAYAAYQRRCRRAFTASFLAAGVFRRAVRTPLLDWLVAAGERPSLQRATARIMAAM